MNTTNKYFMQTAIDEAKKGMGFTSPNPMVGAVIVKDEKIIAKAYHQRDGEAHAEALAIKKAKKDLLKEASMYVTLEPCCHFGRTPPCTNAIIKAGISHVVIAAKDPDKRVAGNGVKILKKAGIKVEVGLLEKESKELNSIYYFNKINNRPYFVLKAALSLDGKIATYKNDSKWISSEKCREVVHKLRKRLRAIAVGKNTVMIDKPKLNCRASGAENKPVDKLIFSNEKTSTESFAKNYGKAFFIDKNVSSSAKSFIDFCNEKKIDSVLIEGGGKVYTWFIENKLVDRIFLFYKPSFIGKDGIPVCTSQGNEFIKKLDEFKIIKTSIIDNNFMVELSKGEPICLLA